MAALALRVTVFLLCLAFGGIYHPASASTIVSDVNALKALSQAWPSTKANNWVGDPCLDHWMGVICDPTNTTVTQLFLYKFGLQGIVPPAIGNLTNLVILELSANRGLGGSLPDEITTLQSLQTLSLQYCQFSGSLPEDLGNLSNLTFLGLNGNNFSGQLPAGLGKTKLTWMDISSNLFNGSIPLAKNSPNGIGLDNITSIEHFHFNNNSFTGTIPVEFFSLPTIQHVLLDHNSFFGELPTVSNISSSLTIMRLDYNQLRGRIPEGYNSSSQINEINFRNNDFAGPLPDFSGLPNLTFLDLSHNNFDPQVFPTWVTLLDNIQTLNLADVNLSGPVPSAVFSLRAIQQLDFSSNQLSGDLDFTGTTSNELVVLDLENNDIIGFSGEPTSNIDGSTLAISLEGNPICQNSYVTVRMACDNAVVNPWQHPVISPQCPMTCRGGMMLNPYQCRCSNPLVLAILLTSPRFTNLETETVPLETDLATQLGLDPNVTYISDMVYLWDSRVNVTVMIFPTTGNALSTSFANNIILTLLHHLISLPEGPYLLQGVLSTENSNSNNLSTKTIIAITVGCVVGVLIVGSSIFVAVYHKIRADKVQKNSPFASWGGGSAEFGEAPKLKGARWFSLAELKMYTNNWSDDNQIGVGGYGKVYRGVLPTGDVVAIKRATEGSMQGANEFKNEIELLSRVHHRNLVGLLGFCYEGGEQALVYEFMSNGTLTDHLSGRGDVPLSWEWRLEIALASARGLSYLHDHASPPIIHRDVKSPNILLNDKFVAKVADFGLSKLAPDEGEKLVYSVNVKGTLGYLDPEYYMTQNLTDKSDVYSFGIVLLEMLTARPPIDGGKFVVREFRTALDRGGVPALLPLLDPVIKEVPVKDLEPYLNIALSCVEESSVDRPTTREVVKQLEGLDVFALQKAAGRDHDGVKKVKFADEIMGDSDGADLPQTKAPRSDPYRYDKARDSFQYSGAVGVSTTVKPK